MGAVKTMNIPSVRRQTDSPTAHEPSESPPANASTTDHARRAAAGERYNAFASRGDEATPSCSSFDDPAHDYDRCGTASVDRPVLFAQQAEDPNEIDVHDVQQDRMGDCYFMATLSALTQSPQGRALIRGAITENRNEQGNVVNYTVTLHQPETHWLGLGRTTFTEVRVTVDAQFANGHAKARAVGDAHEIWPLVMEKAYAQLRGGYNAIAHGGFPADAMQALTGCEAHRSQLGWFRGYRASDLRSDLASGRLVVLGTRRDVQEYGLRGGHSYVATELVVDNGRLCVSLHNPWDSTEPRPVPVDEIARVFHAVDIGSVR
jgi:hypothetical protein